MKIDVLLLHIEKYFCKLQIAIYGVEVLVLVSLLQDSGDAVQRESESPPPMLLSCKFSVTVWLAPLSVCCCFNPSLPNLKLQCQHFTCQPTVLIWCNSAPSPLYNPKHISLKPCRLPSYGPKVVQLCPIPTLRC